MKPTIQKRKILLLLFILMLLLFTVPRLFLHYHQITGELVADSQDHYRVIKNSEMYSFLTCLAVNLFTSFGHEFYGWTAVHTLFQAAAVFSAGYLIYVISDGKLDRTVCLIIGLVCTSAAPVWAPGFEIDVRQMVTGCVEHNITFSVMAPFALLAMALFLKLCPEAALGKKMDIRLYFAFTAALALSTLAKPSFLLGFSLTLLPVLIADFIRTRGKNFKNEFLLGCSVLVSLVATYFQSKFLFGGDTGSGIVFAPFVVYHHFTDICAARRLARSLLFPVLAAVLLFGKIRKNPRAVFCWLFFLISYLIALLFAESGPRMMHGNMTWTSSFAALTLFCACAQALAESMGEKTKYGIVKNGPCALALVWHYLSGIVYVFLLLKGFPPF